MAFFLGKAPQVPGQVTPRADLCGPDPVLTATWLTDSPQKYENLRPIDVSSLLGRLLRPEGHRALRAVGRRATIRAHFRSCRYGGCLAGDGQLGVGVPKRAAARYRVHTRAKRASEMRRFNRLLAVTAVSALLVGCSNSEKEKKE